MLKQTYEKTQVISAKIKQKNNFIFKDEPN